MQCADTPSTCRAHSEHSLNMSFGHCLGRAAPKMTQADAEQTEGAVYCFLDRCPLFSHPRMSRLGSVDPGGLLGKLPLGPCTRQQFLRKLLVISGVLLHPEGSILQGKRGFGDFANSPDALTS